MAARPLPLLSRTQATKRRTQPELRKRSMKQPFLAMIRSVYVAPDLQKRLQAVIKNVGGLQSSG